MGLENHELNIDEEIEEQLTEQLVNLYERWKRCSCGVGTEDDKKDAFFHAIKGRIEKGFHILTKGMYDDENDMEKILGKLYREWKSYMEDCLGEEATVDIFIESAKTILNIALEKQDKDIDVDINMKKEVQHHMELENIGTKTVCGTYILEGELVYLEQEEEGKVKVVTISGISEVVPIKELQEFVDNRNMDKEIKEELDILISHIKKEIGMKDEDDRSNM